MTSAFPIDDHVGAWVPHGRFVVEGAQDGPLRGLRFAAKDLFDVAGHPTGAGNPAWLATHDLPRKSSPLIDQLLAAGATLVGKTITDELAYSIHGDNMHYGTPRNANAPGCVPGGSSSGSVAAVAAGLCDFALGTDTGGSTRVPASYCGVWGLRTTHGLLSREGLVPLSPHFDTPTWLAKDAEVFSRVAEVLLPPSDIRLRRVMLFDDALAQADAVFHAPARRVFDALATQFAATHGNAAEDDLEAWRQTYITASSFDAWQTHGAWITEHRPTFSPAIAGRWDAARKIDAATAAAANAERQRIRTHLHALLGTDGIAVVPSAASVAPLLDATPADIDAIRARTFRITCIAGLGGLPQVSMPFATSDGLPIGISLVGPPGSDRALIALAVALATALRTPP